MRLTANSRRLLVLLMVLALAGSALAGCKRQEPAQRPTEKGGQSQPPTGEATTPVETGGEEAGEATEPPTPEPAEEKAAVKTAVRAYFIIKEKVAPGHRVVEGQALAGGAMKELLAGPTQGEKDNGATTSIPKGTKLLGLKISQGVATVDLSKEFASGGGTLSMTTRVAQVVYTLTQFSNVTGVRFRMEGKALDVLGGEGIELAGVQTRAKWENEAPAILIEDPTIWQVVGYPIRVKGTADVFEGRFFIRMLDAKGKNVWDKPVQASSGTGTRGSFSVKVAPSQWSRGPSKIIAYYKSAKDGKEIVSMVVPIKD